MPPFYELIHALCFVVSTQFVLFPGERRVIEYMSTEANRDSRKQMRTREWRLEIYKDVSEGVWDEGSEKANKGVKNKMSKDMRE